MGYDGGSSFQTYRDVPPSFRYAVPSTASPSIGGTNPNGSGFDSHAVEIAKRGGVFGALPNGTGGGASNPWGIPLGARGLRSAEKTIFNNFDFFFFLHAGYDESGVWQQFGQMQYLTRNAIPWSLGPGPRLIQVEKFFNEYHEWVPVYAQRYANGWGNFTGTWNANKYNANNAGAVARVASYRQVAFWTTTHNEWRKKYDPSYSGYVGPEYDFVFKLSQEDWDWANAYHGKNADEGREDDDSVWDGLTDYLGMPHSNNTRYVPFAPWEAAVGEWSHSSSFAANAAGTNYGTTGAGKSLPMSTQGENDGMGIFAHEFGHIADISDNYRNAWTGTSSGLSDFWDIMSTASRNGPFGRHNGWPVMPIYGNSVPGVGAPNVRNQWIMYDNGDLLDISVADLANGTPLVANVSARNIPITNTLYPNLGVPRYDPATGEGFVKAIRLNFDLTSSSPYFDQSMNHRNLGYANFHLATGTGNGAVNNVNIRNMYVEVVGQTGTESFLPDSGVLLWRVWAATNRGHSVVDSHLYDISLADAMVPDPSTGGRLQQTVPIAHAIQQSDALFKVGKSYTDTGYYRNIREDLTAASDVVAKPGSEYRWEPRDDRPILAGDSVNEWVDPWNMLHFYILDKQYNPAKYGDFLSYKVALRHGNGLAVGGQLELSVKPGSEATTKVPVGNYAKQTYILTNTGATATDIVRIVLMGDLAEGRTTEEVVELTARNDSGRLDARRSFETRVIPTFFSEQNAVVLNDLYSIGAGETIEFDVYVKQVDKNTIPNLAKLLTVQVVSETNPDNSAELAVNGLTLISVTPYAVVEKLNGNKNNLTVTVIEDYDNGDIVIFEETFSINNNAADTYAVGDYLVYVDTKGNTQIRECYIVK